MRIHLPLGAAVLLGCVAASGCGSETLLDRDATAACLRSAYTVSTKPDDLDYLAMDARDGALTAHVGDTAVTIAFERTVSDAKRTEGAYRVFAATLGSSVDDILSRQANAVILWDAAPTDAQRENVVGCLSG